MTPEQREQELLAQAEQRRDDAAAKEREYFALVARAEELSARASTIRAATSELAQVEPQIAAHVVWRDFLTTARKTLADELLAFPARIYDDREWGRKQNVELSIFAIDQGFVGGNGYTLETLRLGTLMIDAGYVVSPSVDGRMGQLPWFGSLPVVEERLRNLQQRRDDAQAHLDEAMLDDAERERLAAERAAERASRNAMPRRKVRGDGSQYDKYPDGRVVEVQPSATANPIASEESQV